MKPLVEEVAKLEAEIVNYVKQLESENEALREFLGQVKAMLAERYQPHVIARQIDVLLTKDN